jgi:hypothetical protein
MRCAPARQSLRNARLDRRLVLGKRDFRHHKHQEKQEYYELHNFLITPNLSSILPQFAPITMARRAIEKDVRGNDIDDCSEHYG